jgi:predicted metalloprotease
MRFGDGSGGGNFEDRTGQSGGGMSFGGMGGGLFGLVFSLVASRFGIVGMIILGLGYCALPSLGGSGLLGGGGGSSATSSATQGESTLTAEQRRILIGTNDSAAQVWTQIFQQAGARYKVPTLVAYTRGSQSGCGAAQAAMGPFYCPTDKRIYMDPVFFNELSQRFQAPGDFAMAYVIAHEVGHHVQNLTGTLEQAQNAQSRAGTVGGNQIQVSVELQADCYAGVWAANDKNLMEAGDLEEGMRAAEAIGDDTLQQQSQGRVRPESFTHGSAAQRMAALRKGLETGDPASCQF